ncbi:hypothetical protein AX16_002195 [Volvariella volvacea WC 439]|nr:hypothetical protein AX16_002195 [Volvariella volvacea WC 439]
MFLHQALLSFALIVTALASPSPTRRASEHSINPPLSALVGRSYRPISQVEARSLTNAKRLAAHLPLKPPRRRNPGTEGSQPQPSGSPLNKREGCIGVSNDGINIGYVSKNWNVFGESTITSTIDNCMHVRLDTQECEAGTSNIETINGPDEAFPYLGGIVGYSSISDNIGPGSYNYVYFGGTTQTSPHSPPSTGANSFTARTGISRKIESSIWTCHRNGQDNTYHLSAQWINTDHGEPVGYVGFTQVGDMGAFVAQFGATQWLEFTFVPF